jgi:hypothetical protein
VQNLVSKVFFGGVFGLGRLQTMTAEEAEIVKAHFLTAVRAQGSPVSISYTEALVDIFDKVVQKMFVTDPNVLHVLTDPSEKNIRRLILTTAKVLTDRHS